LWRYGKNRHIMPNISECPGPTLTYFTDLVGILVGMIFQIFVWRSPKGRCYGNQLNMGGVRKRRMEWIYSLLRHSITDWPIINPLSKGSMAIIRLHCAKFSELPSSNIGVYAVKTCNFCRDSPAIWRWSSFVMLVFPNGLEDCNFDFSRVIISVPLVAIWLDLVQWPRSLRHKKFYSRRRKFFWGDFGYFQ